MFPPFGIVSEPVLRNCSLLMVAELGPCRVFRTTIRIPQNWIALRSAAGRSLTAEPRRQVLHAWWFSELWALFSWGVTLVNDRSLSDGENH